MTTPSIIVFAGPCLPVSLDDRWRLLLDQVELRPPAGRGDLLASLIDQPTTLLLLDGYYYSRPAVSHKEILYALDEGVRVIGAASMGALRAAEMAPYGMIGVGEVFARFSRGDLDGDDEVAVLHLPESHGYVPQTIASVELRHALESLTRRGETTDDDAATLVDRVRALPFTERWPERIEQLAKRHLGAEAARRLDTTLATDSIKRRDSLEALQLAVNSSRLELADEGTRARSPRRTTFFLDHFRALHNRHPSHGEAKVHDFAVLRVAQALHPDFERWLHQQRLRFLLASAAHHQGRNPEHVDRLAEIIADELRENGTPLPATDCLEEARIDSLAILADPAALEELASHLGLPSSQAQSALLDYLDRAPEQMRPWLLIRSFLRSPASQFARHTAAAALAIFDCHRRRARGKRITRAQLTRVAAALWHVSLDHVPRAATRRGINDKEEFRAVLEPLTPAELLVRPINDYPVHKARLCATPLIHQHQTEAHHVHLS